MFSTTHPNCCSGCGRNFTQTSYLIQHQDQTTKSQCRAAGQAWVDALRRGGKHSPRRSYSPPSLRYPNTSSPPLSPEQFTQKDGPNCAPHFEGDFFGNDYGPEDLPGFGDGSGDTNNIQGTTGQEDEDDTDHDGDDSQTELEETWEAPRKSVTVDGNGDKDDHMDIDSAVQPKSSFLRSLPAHHDDAHVTVFGGKAGTPIPGSDSAQVSYNSSDGFLHYESQIPGIEANRWAPFTSHVDWEIAQWAKMRGPSSTAFSELLEIKGVCEALGLSYRSKVVIAGEAFDLYKRDILECICALYGSPEHVQYLYVAPERHYSDADKTCRLYHDLYTSKWWWATQTALEAETPGATIIPVISSITPLKEAGIHGIDMRSGDGVKRRCHPILAAYVGDYPEQILVTCAYSGDCPVCMSTKEDLGEFPCTSPFRDPEKSVAATKLIGTNGWVHSCLDANIKPVQHPFWEDLPFTDIFRSITPDILHQMYQGVMKHLIGWITSICGANEIDARIHRLHPNHSIRQFHKGISTLSQVLQTFHDHKQVFIDLNVRQHFNIPKVHFMCHYVRAIKLFGTCDSYNTETTEQLHIDFAKDAYRASNRKDEYTQMTKWLERQEKIHYHSHYLAWRRTKLTSTTSTSFLSVPPLGLRYDFPGAMRTLQDL
ncbi:hypothetical protein EV368DRAFT_86547 [Lentinula lateritia]|nr:hypothetical protein EV368DRAFT_86547 [Lentinula lateritia]